DEEVEEEKKKEKDYEKEVEVEERREEEDEEEEEEQKEEKAEDAREEGTETLAAFPEACDRRQMLRCFKTTLARSLAEAYPNQGPVHDLLQVASLVDPRFKAKIQEDDPHAVKLLKAKVRILRALCVGGP
ncbi:unnamed protein product, partial [Protopolystoma xenopodis]